MNQTNFDQDSKLLLASSDTELTFELIDRTFLVIENYLNSGDLDPLVKERLYQQFSRARDSLYLQVDIGHE